ncbi:MAG: trans-aconitate 2-methyltransferase [Planctomycetota bacterium]
MSEILRSDEELAGWRALADGSCAGLLEAVNAIGDLEAITVAELSALRALALPRQVARALELVRSRRRAIGKLADSESWLLDREGLEQASGTLVAQYKARRFVELGVDRVLDLCCGVGADARELTAMLPAADVLAVDLDPLRTMMTAHNAGCRVEVADVRDLDLGAAALHVDPARRVEGGGGRRWRLKDHRPGPEFLSPLCVRQAPAAIKLGPGIDFGELPEFAATEIEILGTERGLVQAVVWCGPIAHAAGLRTATRVDRGLSFRARPRSLPVDPALRRYLVVPEPALERAGLVAARVPELAELAPGLGLCSVDAPLPDPWFRNYEILESVAWRNDRIAAALARQDVGALTVKIRGKVADANEAQRRWQGNGSQSLVLFGFRQGTSARAIIARESS